MATQSLSFRLESELVPLVDQHAKTADQERGPFLAELVKAYLHGNGHGKTAHADELLARHDQILLMLRNVTAGANSLKESVDHKERETNVSFAQMAKHISDLRTDIATLFAAALQSFAGVEPDEATAFTQKYMYPSARRA